jgi:hypothetical protein
MLTPMNFERKFDFSKTRKNTYMGSIGTANPVYESDGTEMQSFGQFLPQTGNLR